MRRATEIANGNDRRATTNVYVVDAEDSSTSIYIRRHPRAIISWGFFYHCCCLVEISYGLFSFWKLQLLPLTVKQSVTLARHVFICFPYNTVQCKCVSQSLHFSCGNDRVGFNFWNHKCYRSIGKCIERRARMIADGMNTTVAAMKLQHETGKMEKNNLQVRINKRGERGE